MSPAPPRAGRRLLAATAAAALAVALLGGLATEIGPWYRALRKPAWQPPDAAFGPVWTLLYALCAWSAARALAALGDDAAARRRLLAAWALNALLHVGWSAVFFTLRRPDAALVVVVLLWASIVGLMVLSAATDRRSAWLLAPYLAWVGFAAVLNLAVVRLNAPFGADLAAGTSAPSSGTVLGPLLGLVQAVMLLEAVLLWAGRRRWAASLAAMLWSLAAGALLVAALQLVVAGLALPWPLLPLAAAGIAHALALRAMLAR